jgi:hypothetical protein
VGHGADQSSDPKAPTTCRTRGPVIFDDQEERLMLFRSAGVLAITVGFVALAGSAVPAGALTMQECSAKYKAAQQAGTLKGMKWNDFRKAECGASASATPAAAPAATTAPTPPARQPTAAAPPTRQPTAAAPARPTTTTGIGGPANAVFPPAVSPKYSNESAGKARMHTCLDQYNANKASNGNGGLKWIEKGGGYYSECNKRLKG